jgi:hypothetical protein
MRGLTISLITLVLVFVIVAKSLAVVTLPCYATFDNDTLGQPPSVGGPNMPTNFGGSGSVVVQTTALGISTQPVVLEAASNQYSYVQWFFEPIVNSILRFEATVSISGSFGNFYTMSLGGDLGQFVDIYSANGKLQMRPTFQEVGAYVPGVPFRVRIDADPQNQQSYVIIDNEMNGFPDDLTILVTGSTAATNLWNAGFSVNPAMSSSGQIAWDNISLSIVPEPSTIILLSIGVISLIAYRGRRRAR